MGNCVSFSGPGNLIEKQEKDRKAQIDRDNAINTIGVINPIDEQNDEDMQKFYNAVNEKKDSILESFIQQRNNNNILPQPNQLKIEEIYGSNYQSLEESKFFTNGQVDILKEAHISQEDKMDATRKRFEEKLLNAKHNKNCTQKNSTLYISNRYDSSENYEKSKREVFDQ